MYKLIAIYRQPADVDSFEAHYRDVHTPLVQKIPGLKEVRLNRVTGTPGGRGQLHLIAELCFESEEAFKSAMKSDENRAAGRDLMGFAKDIVDIQFARESIL